MIEGEHLELGNEALVSKQSGRWLPKLSSCMRLYLATFVIPSVGLAYLEEQHFKGMHG